MVTEDVAARVTGYIQHQGKKSPDAIIDLVTETQKRYLDTVSGLDDEVAAKKPAPDEWSVRELIRHVIDAEEGVSMLVERLSRSQEWERGRGAGRMVDDDGRAFAAYVDELRGVNAKLIDAIRNVPASPDMESKAPHPFFGPLNCLEWAVFQRVHDADHVQHAEKILAAVGGS